MQYVSDSILRIRKYFSYQKMYYIYIIRIGIFVLALCKESFILQSDFNNPAVSKIRHQNQLYFFFFLHF